MLLIRVENILNCIFSPHENIGHRFVLEPFRLLLKQIDPLTQAIEGRQYKKILQISIYPSFISLTIRIGFKLVDILLLFSLFFFAYLEILKPGK
ncbi:MAG: hypothetical protein SH818_13520 [Saprospiraceae bacterium]|nr:hypothetical protein [Saprospiraceae bacterium]